MTYRSNRHVEDGMGFAGLAPTANERRQDRAEQALRNEVIRLRAALSRIETQTKDYDELSRLGCVCSIAREALKSGK